MKGSLVSRVKKAATTCRAAANILVARARREPEVVAPFIFGRGEDKLRKENQDLRSELEKLHRRLEDQKAPASPPVAVRNRSTKRARKS